MPALSKSLARDAVIIKRRYDNHLYAINPKTYHDLMETIRLYNESIYLLPDFETVDAVGADQQNASHRYRLKVNEIMFV